MIPQHEIERRYNIHVMVEILEATKHMRDGEPQRAIHHFLKTYEPDMAFTVYKLSGGKAKSLRGMLMESKEIVKESDGIDWITPLYGEEYKL